MLWKVVFGKMIHPTNITQPDNVVRAAATSKNEDRGRDGQFPGGKYLTDAGCAWMRTDFPWKYSEFLSKLVNLTEMICRYGNPDDMTILDPLKESPLYRDGLRWTCFANQQPGNAKEKFLATYGSNLLPISV